MIAQQKLIYVKQTSVLRCFVLLLVCYFVLLPRVQAVTPAPDGAYPGANTAEGQGALLNLNIAGGGVRNTGLGANALAADTTGHDNTAVGLNSLRFNMLGEDNTAVGVVALFRNITGERNVAIGDGALLNNNSDDNTAVGFNALRSNTSGERNTVVGDNAGGAVSTASGVVCIGQGVPGANVNNTTYVRNVNTVAQANSVFVTVGAGGRLGFQVSSQRYKDEIKSIGNASAAIYALKPRSFRYKQEIDPAHPLDFGLIAEEVAAVNSDLVARDEAGNIITVRYNAVNAMLLNEFLKEHRKNEEQEATIAQLKKQVEALTRGLQKVSAQVELKTATPQTVANNQ
jgi:trimeric autotransporter adhesin